MRTTLGAVSAVVLSVGLLGACSKKEETTAAAPVEAAAADASAAAGAATDPGGAVSPPPANGNEAVNTDGNMADASQSSGSNSFTEGQARGHIEEAGYTDVTGLMKTPEGMWTGKAKKNGKTTDVSVDFKGAVSAK